MADHLTLLQALLQQGVVEVVVCWYLEKERGQVGRQALEQEEDMGLVTVWVGWS